MFHLTTPTNKYKTNTLQQPPAYETTPQDMRMILLQVLLKISPHLPTYDAAHTYVAWFINTNKFEWRGAPVAITLLHSPYQVGTWL